MYYLKYENENIFLVKHNKIILTKYDFYYKFIDNIINVNDKKIEINGLGLNTKNTLVIDFTSVSSALRIFNNDNKVIEEYIKFKLENSLINIEAEEKINDMINDMLIELYGDLKTCDTEIDILKLIKSNSNLSIKNKDDFLEILREILESNNLKNIFVIYKKGILNYLKLSELEDIEHEKLILFEICDKESTFDENDNILFFDKSILQITYRNFIELIMSKLKIQNINKDLYKYLINKIFFYSINGKEVDIMKKHLNEVDKINNVLKNEFEIDLKETLGYI